MRCRICDECCLVSKPRSGRIAEGGIRRHSLQISVRQLAFLPANLLSTDHRSALPNADLPSELRKSARPMAKACLCAVSAPTPVLPSSQNSCPVGYFAVLLEL